MKTKIYLILLIMVFYTTKSYSSSRREGASKSTFGIDISDNNGNINWKMVKLQKKHEVKFVIIRSTMGDDRKDKNFLKNFKSAKKHGFIVGTYHYYDPNENPTKQIRNFLKNVKLSKGDIVPVVDIEKLSRKRSLENLRSGLKKMLLALEKHYGKKPMIYTSCSFFHNYLKDRGFEEYPLWIAAYNPNKINNTLVKDAHIHQFGEKIRIKGINKYVDGNHAKSLGSILL